MPTPPALSSGSPSPLGATWDGHGTNFAVYAGGAESIELCLFDPDGHHETQRLTLAECTDGVWHGRLDAIGPGQLYGYRAYGPYQPHEGLRYNGNKLLLDPYARRLAGELRWSDALYGYRLTSARSDLSFDRRNSAFAVPKAIVTSESFDWGDDRPPRTPWSQTVIYEAHLRGLTRGNPHIPERERGTWAALGHELTVGYLRGLGITAVELMPVHAFVDDRRLVERGLVNYWGYNSLCYFAPEPRYLASGALDEIKRTIRALHAAGLEVLLDVVYNHTCEGSELGPTLSWRGLDNAAYYRLLPDDPRRCDNLTGTGNALNFSHPRVIQMTLDSLRYWVEEFHVDGFRFDLGVTLGRETGGFETGAGFFDALMQDPTLAHVKLISEPWDLGPGGYQLGRQPAGMAEWNDKYRDDVRRFWRGDSEMRGALAGRLQGSADLFDHDRRLPWASVNFLTAHDGFTLRDWASYNEKHNEANGEDNRDGSDDNASNNWGVEGPTDDAAVEHVRAQVCRAMLATLLCSQGTPMLLSGDEFGRTQQGNNNPYCQDSALTWLDWAAANSEPGEALRGFVAHLIGLRRQLATLRAAYYQHGRFEPVQQVRDIEWFDEKGDTMRPEDWNSGHGRLLCVRRAVRLDSGHTEISVLLINSTEEPQGFELPQPWFQYTLRLDSSEPTQREQPVPDTTVTVAAHSLQLLSAVVEGQSPQTPLHKPEDVAAQPGGPAHRSQPQGPPRPPTTPLTIL